MTKTNNAIPKRCFDVSGALIPEKFYNWVGWRKLSQKVKKDNNFECVMCNENGKLSIATCVHHKIPISKAPYMAIDESNLIPLCNECHNIVHAEKGGYKPKKSSYEKYQQATAIEVVYGGIGSGKTTYVQNNKTKNSFIWDFDYVMSAFGGVEVHERNYNLIPFIRDVQKLFIDKMLYMKLDKIFIIGTDRDKLEYFLNGVPNVTWVDMNVSPEEQYKRVSGRPNEEMYKKQIIKVANTREERW